MVFRTHYSAPSRVSMSGFSASRTKQAFREDCDINVIVRRYAKAGVLPTEAPGASYGDFSTVGDYFDSMQLLLRTRERFEALPSLVRERFANDPSRMLAFVADAGNADEARKLGLLAPLPPPKEEPSVVREPVKPA